MVTKCHAASGGPTTSRLLDRDLHASGRPASVGGHWAPPCRIAETGFERVDGRARPAIIGVVAASRSRWRPPAPGHRAHAGRLSAGPVRSPRAAPTRRLARTATGVAAG